jgi:hypothetical protein
MTSPAEGAHMAFVGRYQTSKRLFSFSWVFGLARLASPTKGFDMRKKIETEHHGYLHGDSDRPRLRRPALFRRQNCAIILFASGALEQAVGIGPPAAAGATVVSATPQTVEFGIPSQPDFGAWRRHSGGDAAGHTNLRHGINASPSFAFLSRAPGSPQTGGCEIAFIHFGKSSPTPGRGEIPRLGTNGQRRRRVCRLTLLSLDQRPSIIVERSEE